MIEELEILPLTRFRRQTQKVLSSLPRQGGYYLVSRSQPEAVLLDRNEYKRMNLLIEDLLDALELEKARGEKVLPWKTYLKHRYGSAAQPKSL